MSYRGLVRTPFFVRLLTGSWIGRLPTAMAAIAIPLVVRKAGADFAFVGVAAATYAISVSIGAPALGRLVDRVGQPRVLAPTAVLAAVGFAVIALAPHQPAAVLVGAALTGAATPPLEPCLRVLWPEIVRDGWLESAYAADSAAQEMIFICGPIVVAACVAVASPVAALWVAACLGVAGVVVVATAAPSRRWRPAHRSTDWLGPLRSRGLLVLLGAAAGCGAAIGSLNVLVVSYAERQHVPGGAPILLTLNAGGALLGVLGYGVARWRMSLPRRAALFAAGMVVGYGLLTVVPPPPLMMGLMVLSGLFLAPLLTVSFVLVGQLAPPGTVAEAFSWEITLFTAGTSIGSGAVGAVLQVSNQHWAAACGALGVTGSLAVLLAGRKRLLPA